MESLNKTRAFLTEFIIVILFFSVAAVITIGLYVEANNKNDESVLLSKASTQAQSVAECIRAESALYDNVGIYTEYLDEDMLVVSEEEAEYIQKVIVNFVEGNDNMAGDEYQYDIIIEDAKSGESVYSLSVRQYKSKEVQR